MGVSRGLGMPLIVRPGQGSDYGMGRMRSVFHADGAKTDNRYSVSEWWLEPRTSGVGTHAHADGHIFHVLAGTLSLVIDGERTEAPRGSYVVIPGGVEHGFENRGAEHCRFTSINAPAGFEQKMPDIVAWFAKAPHRDLEDA